MINHSFAFTQINVETNNNVHSNDVDINNIELEFGSRIGIDGLLVLKIGSSSFGEGVRSKMKSSLVDDDGVSWGISGKEPPPLPSPDPLPELSKSSSMLSAKKEMKHHH